MNQTNISKFARKLFIYLAVLLSVAFVKSNSVLANIQSTQEEKITFNRSIESLRDLDYQTWQLVVYESQTIDSQMVLRIIGYPGSLRFNHPMSLRAASGRRDWLLKDITLSNPQLVDDTRQAAAEFDMTPLLVDLNKNRPIRLSLQGVFIDLPVPPYLVSEWRSLQIEEKSDEQL